MKTLKEYIIEKYDKNILGEFEDDVRQEVKKQGIHLNVVGSCIAFYGEKNDNYTEFIVKVEKCLKISKTYQTNKQDIKSFHFTSKDSKKPVWWFGPEEAIKRMSTDLKKDGETISEIK